MFRTTVLSKPLPILATSFALFSASVAAGDVLHVPSQYPSTAIAIANANPGDEVVLAAGSYGNVVGITNKSDLIIRGEGKVTVAKVPGAAYGIFILGSTNIRIENLKVGYANNYGVIVENSQGVQLLDLAVKDVDVAGVWVKGSSDVRVLSCDLVDTNIGVHAQTPCVVSQSTITNAVSSGILLEGENSVATENSIKGCGNGVVANADGALIQGNAIKSPVVNGVHIDALSSGHIVNANVITKAGAYGILVNAQRSVITSNKVKKGKLFDIQNNGTANHFSGNKGKVNG